MTRRSEAAEHALSKHDRMTTALAHKGLLLSIAISVAFVFGLATLQSHAHWIAWLRLSLGCLVGAEGYALSTNWHDARDLTSLRIRSTDRRQRLGSRTRVGSLLISLGLQLLGVLWIGIGLFLIVRAVAVLV